MRAKLRKREGEGGLDLRLAQSLDERFVRLALGGAVVRDRCLDLNGSGAE